MIRLKVNFPEAMHIRVFWEFQITNIKSLAFIFSSRKGQNMQMLDSLRCQQIDTSTVEGLVSIFQNNAGTHLSTLRSLK